MSEPVVHVIDHADGRIEGVEVASDGITLYRGHKIYFEPPPIPIRTVDWHYYHEDYDGPGDNRHGDGPSLADCKAQIDDWWLDQPMLTDAEQKAQALRCACRGSDDYCLCGNVPDKETREARAANEAASDAAGAVRP